jgi:superfamily II DNA or RNA helicase
MMKTKQLTRDERQIEVLRNWRKSNFCGIFQAATGFGKTYTAIMAIKGMVPRAGITSCLVVVPTLELKSQWEAELKKNKISFAKVMVINSAIKQKHKVDMLVLDEIHRYAAESFRSIFNNVLSDYILGLTATLEREDNFHELILEYLPVFDEVTVDDALDNEWIAPYKVYNIPVRLSPEDQIEYNKANNAFKHFAAKLGHGGQAFKNATSYLKSSDKSLQGQAGAYYNSMRKRKNICQNNNNKILATKQIIDNLSDRNGLIFSATTEFAENLQNTLGDICMTFHSKIKRKDQELIVKRFKDKRTKVRFLSSVQALNEGFNVPDCSLAIIAGSTSTKRTFIQQLGRVVRKQPDKEAIIINLYTPGTQEEVWMKKRLEGINKDRVVICELEEFLNLYTNGNSIESNITQKEWIIT